MNKNKVIEFFQESLKKEREHKEGYTYWQTLDIIDDKEFAIVLGWQDGFDTEDGWELCMKLAYLPTNSLMSEYNIDWLMPYDEQTNEVDDTEMVVTCDSDVVEAVNYLLSVYDSRYKQAA